MSSLARQLNAQRLVPQDQAGGGGKLRVASFLFEPRAAAAMAPEDIFR